MRHEGEKASAQRRRRCRVQRFWRPSMSRCPVSSHRRVTVGCNCVESPSPEKRRVPAMPQWPPRLGHSAPAHVGSEKETEVKSKNRR